MRLRLRPFEPHRAPQTTPAQSPSTQSRPTDPSSGPIWYQSSSWKPILGAGRSNHEVVRGEILDRAVAAPTLRAHPQSGGYGKGGRESFLGSVTAIQTKSTGLALRHFPTCGNPAIFAMCKSSFVQIIEYSTLGIPPSPPTPPHMRWAGPASKNPLLLR